MPQFIFSFENYNFYLNWLNLANHFGGTSSTNSKVPFICYQKAMELSGNNVHACYKVVFDFYNNTKDYDKKYGIVLKRLKECFEHGQGTEEERAQILEAIKEHEDVSNLLKL